MRKCYSCGFKCRRILQTLNVGYRPYEKDMLNDLRAEFAQTHVFKRDGKDDRIIEIPVVAGAEPLSDKSMEVDLGEAW